MHQGTTLGRIFYELLSCDRGEGRVKGKSSLGTAGLDLISTSQGPTPEDARLPARRAYSSDRMTVISAVAVDNS